MDHKRLPILFARNLRLLFIVALLVGLGHIPAASAATRGLTFVEAAYEGLPKYWGAESVAVSLDGKHMYGEGFIAVGADSL